MLEETLLNNEKLKREWQELRELAGRENKYIHDCSKDTTFAAFIKNFSTLKNNEIIEYVKNNPDLVIENAIEDYDKYNFLVLDNRVITALSNAANNINSIISFNKLYAYTIYNNTIAYEVLESIYDLVCKVNYNISSMLIRDVRLIMSREFTAKLILAMYYDCTNSIISINCLNTEVLKYGDFDVDDIISIWNILVPHISDLLISVMNMEYNHPVPLNRYTRLGYAIIEYLEMQTEENIYMILKNYANNPINGKPPRFGLRVLSHEKYPRIFNALTYLTNQGVIIY